MVVNLRFGLLIAAVLLAACGDKAARPPEVLACSLQSSDHECAKCLAVKCSAELDRCFWPGFHRGVSLDRERGDLCPMGVRGTNPGNNLNDAGVADPPLYACESRGLCMQKCGCSQGCIDRCRNPFNNDCCDDCRTEKIAACRTEKCAVICARVGGWL